MTATEMPALSGREIMAALRCCSSNAREGGGCGACPMDGRAGRLECSEMICRMAADEIGRLLDANEKTADGLTRRLADMAREGNTALERGLEGVNLAKLAEMTGIQSELEAFGRGSVIRAEPAGRMDGSMRIREVVVEGRVVFHTDAQEIATSPAAPRNDMETGGPDG